VNTRSLHPQSKQLTTTFTWVDQQYYILNLSRLVRSFSAT